MAALCDGVDRGFRGGDVVDRDVLRRSGDDQKGGIFARLLEDWTKSTSPIIFRKGS